MPTEDRQTTLARFATNTTRDIGSDDMQAFVNTMFDQNVLFSGTPNESDDLPANIQEIFDKVEEITGTSWRSQLPKSIEEIIDDWEGQIGFTDGFIELPDLPLTRQILEDMKSGVSYTLPKLITGNLVPGVPRIADDPVNNLMTVGLSPYKVGFQAKDAFVVRVAKNEWKLVGRKFTGSPDDEPFMFTLVMKPSTPAGTILGGIMSFISDNKELRDELGPVAALGNEDLVSIIARLEQRIQTLEHHSAHHPDVSAVEFTLHGAINGHLWELSSSEAALWDGSEHIVDIDWSTATHALTNVESVVVKGADEAHTGPIRFLGDQFVTIAMVETWITHGTHVTIKWDATAHSFRFIKATQVGVVA